MNKIWSWLRRHLSVAAVPQPGESIHTSCRHCDRAHLFRRPGGTFIECSCGARYSEDEYKMLAEEDYRRERGIW